MRTVQGLVGLGFDIAKLAWQRLWYEPGLTGALLAGWLAAVALIAAIPMYTDAINQALLRKELAAETNTHRPAFGFLFHYVGSTRTAPWEGLLAAQRYLAIEAGADLKLPLQTRLHYARSNLFQFFPTRGGAYTRGNEPLGRVHLGYLAEMEGLVTLVEGVWPVATWSSGEPLDVLVSRALADELGLQAGEVYDLFTAEGVAGAASPRTRPVRISGIWQATNPAAGEWYLSPTAFATTLLVSEAAYLNELGDQLPQPLYEVGWYLLFDGGAIRAEDVLPFLERIALVEQRASTLLSGLRLTLSPVAALQRYQVTVGQQALLILLLGLPVIGLILLFIGLIAQSMVDRQLVEIAIFKSRGSSNGQIAAIFLLQALILALLALALGLPLGRLAAQGMSNTRNFLNFEQVTPLVVVITRESVRYAAVAALAALVVTVWPVSRISRLSVVTSRRRIDANQSGPRWQSMGFDLALLGMTGYSYYLLSNQGAFARLVERQVVDPWQNPLLFLTPSLFLLVAARLYLKLLPALLVLAEQIIKQLPGVTLLLALRILARSHQQHTVLITLLVLTAGLGAYITSFARTADEHLIARTSYRIGAPVAVVEGAGRIDSNVTANSMADSGARGQNNNPTALSGWAVLPVTEHFRVPGVEAAARVGRFQATVRTPAGMIQGELYGIDREDFPRVAYFRRDFAPLTLGALMNELALEPAGILVSRQFIQRTSLQIGDTFQLTGLVAGSNQPLVFEIVGVLDLFPTAYPGEREFFVANLEYIFNELGGPVPYYVWLAVDDALTADTLRAELETVGFTVLQLDDVRLSVAAEQAQPERIGLFGFFSLGFLVTSWLSVLALITHAALVYQSRYVQVGILRAMGLSARQVAFSQAGEYLFVAALGILGGAWLGLLCSDLFIPFMQMGYQPVDLIPPFAVVIAWQEVLFTVGVVMGATVIVTAVVAWLLTRLQLFQAIKLGETLAN